MPETAQPGAYTVGSTWVGGAVPAAGEDVLIRHPVTTSGLLTRGGLTEIDSSLLLGGAFRNQGGVIQHPGSSVVVNGNYDINMDFNSIPSWTFKGERGNPCVLQAADGFGFSWQCGNTRHVEITGRYGIIRNWGRGNSAADHALVLNSHNSSSRFELDRFLIHTYWRMRYGAGWSPAADATYLFLNSSFRDPQYTDIFEYTCAADFEEDKRGVIGCDFVGSATNRRFYIGNPGASWSNRFRVEAVGQDVTWENLFGAPVDLKVLTRFKNYTGGDLDIHMSTLNAGNWRVHDFIVSATRDNAHIVSSSGGDVGGGIIEDGFTFGVNSADNHYAFDAGTIYRRLVAVGGNAILSTSVGSGTPLVERITHIMKPGNGDAFVLQETNNFIAGAITLRDYVVIGTGTERGVTAITGPAQDYAYMDGGVFHNIADHYQNVTAANDTITEGQAGFGGSDLTVDPQLVNPNATLETWDTSLGGPGTADNVYQEAIKRNGYDINGNPATFNPEYSLDKALLYLREAFTPQNPALNNSGFNGMDKGAIRFDPEVRYYLTPAILDPEWEANPELTAQPTDAGFIPQHLDRLKRVFTKPGDILRGIAPVVIGRDGNGYRQAREAYYIILCQTRFGAFTEVDELPDTYHITKQNFIDNIAALGALGIDTTGIDGATEPKVIERRINQWLIGQDVDFEQYTGIPGTI